MTVDGVVAAGRAAAESLMLDTCEVDYPTGRTVQDEATGRQTPVYAVRLTSPCKVQTSALSLSVGESGAGGRVVTEAVSEVHFPYDTAGLQVGDRVKMLAVGPATVPAVLGGKFLVVGFNLKSHATSLKVKVERALS